MRKSSEKLNEEWDACADITLAYRCRSMDRCRPAAADAMMPCSQANRLQFHGEIGFMPLL